MQGNVSIAQSDYPEKINVIAPKLYISIVLKGSSAEGGEVMLRRYKTLPA